MTKQLKELWTILQKIPRRKFLWKRRNTYIRTKILWDEFVTWNKKRKEYSSLHLPLARSFSLHLSLRKITQFRGLSERAYRSGSLVNWFEKFVNLRWLRREAPLFLFDRGRGGGVTRNMSDGKKENSVISGEKNRRKAEEWKITNQRTNKTETEIGERARGTENHDWKTNMPCASVSN